MYPETPERPIKFQLVSNMKKNFLIQLVYNEFLLGLHPPIQYLKGILQTTLFIFL